MRKHPKLRWLAQTLRTRVLPGSLLVALLGGCNLTQWHQNGFKVGPNYCPPPVPVASHWTDCPDPRMKCQPADLRSWWAVFHDSELNHLIATASQQNLTLRAAGARILEAHALRSFARGSLFPQIQQAEGSYNRQKLSAKSPIPPFQQWFQEWQAGAIVSWELDVWGRFRRLLESADADWDASIEGYDDVMVILLAEVATNYVRLRTAQWRLYYAWLNVTTQSRQLQIAKDKWRLGASTELGVRQTETVLETTRSLIPRLEAEERLANNQLCVLLGIPPRELKELGVGVYSCAVRNKFKELEQRIQTGVGKDVDAEKELPKPSSPIPCAPPEVVVGIPADLVRQRPDVRQAERGLAAQSARIGVAESDLYPRLSLNGTLGVDAEFFWDLFDTPESLFASIGPSFQWNILNYGRILSLVQFQDARFQRLVFEYQDLVLRAGREAEDAIIQFLRSQQRVQTLDRSVKAASRTVEISEDQFRLGARDLTGTSLFQRILAEQQDALAAEQGEVALSLIRLYRALGGGWEIRFMKGPHGGMVGSGTPLPWHPSGPSAGKLQFLPAQPAPPEKSDVKEKSDPKNRSGASSDETKGKEEPTSKEKETPLLLP